MPWNGSPPNQQAGRTDGVRTGDDVYAQQAAAPVDVDATLFDIHDTDLKDMINACFKKDGGNTATANLPMGGFTLTNIAASRARTMPARFSQLQDNLGQYIATVGGTADAITLTPSPVITAYAAGQRFSFIASGDQHRGDHGQRVERWRRCDPAQRWVLHGTFSWRHRIRFRRRYRAQWDAVPFAWRCDAWRRSHGA